MATPRLSPELALQALQAFKDAGGDKAAAARSLGLHVNTYRKRLDNAAKLEGVSLKRLAAGGKVEGLKVHRAKMPRKGDVKRYIVTSIQNNTKVWPGFNNLVALADHHGAELLVGTFTYNKSAYGEGSTKWGTHKDSDDDKMWYDPEVERFICDKRVQLAPGLVWCGEMNILPTATDPLNGFETYAGRQSCIFPHSKMEMRSVISGKREGTKFNYTTGTLGQRNYIQKRAGLRAEEQHCYGGLIVEVTSDGSWFVRQLQAGDDDAIYDLDLRVQAGTVAECPATETYVESVTWGDIHEISLQSNIRKLMFGKGGMLDALRPRYQFMHDVLDFRSRNHHDMKNPHKMFEKHVSGVESVRKEILGVRNFLAKESHRPWCQTVVVPSNHDEAMTRWLREADYKVDPVNSVFYLERQLAHYRAIEAGNSGFLDLEDALASLGGIPKDVRFLRRDEDFVTCKTKTFPGIENGLHGDTWANLMKYGRPLNIGHRHGAGIFGHLWVSGMSADLDQGYNVGPSNWSHTHTVTYVNGRRTLVTMWADRYRA